MGEKTISAEEYARFLTPEMFDWITRLYQGGEFVFLGQPVVADVDRIVVSRDWPSGAESATIAAQPDVPRNLTFALTDADNSCTGTITITGLDVHGRAVTETVTVGGGTKTLTGTKIFRSVTSVGVATGAGGTPSTDVYVVGVGNLIGLPFDLPSIAAVKLVKMGTATITLSSSTVKVGTSISAVDGSGSTYDGAKILSAVVKPVVYA